DLFDADTAQAIADRYIRLLDAICDDPDIRIGDIDVLSAAERQRILVDWNDTDRPVPHDTVAALFEAQAAAVPTATAVLFEDTQLSYADLNTRANQVAHALIARGIGPEDIVGICQHRAPEMIVSLLGILKAGAAYLPLDPDYPEDRLRFMLQDAEPALVLAQTATTA
ncbi:AMP-binding protein, partial [Tateyamaria omphalii]|uniref:AMP-binding protein n=1 Tax=Tateyamaria omphalii TaxID=299262 RepID=UPI0016730A39